MDGLLLLRKPSGPTSHDCVVRLRKILGEKRIGHFGTLDPFAEGLLLAGIGKATRLFPFFGTIGKTYEGVIRLGQATDTYDRTGTALGPAADSLPAEEDVLRAMARFRGDLIQLAPPFSAKKLAGKPLYVYARGGAEVERRPAAVRVDRFELRSYAPPDIDFEVSARPEPMSVLWPTTWARTWAAAPIPTARPDGHGQHRLDEAKPRGNRGRPPPDALRRLDSAGRPSGGPSGGAADGRGAGLGQERTGDRPFRIGRRRPARAGSGPRGRPPPFRPGKPPDRPGPDQGK